MPTRAAPLRRIDSLPDPPWARVHRIPLIRREVRERLSPNALELLFARAEVVIEGGAEVGTVGEHDDRVYATVMVTIDLGESAGQLRERADEATTQRVVELMREAPDLRARLVGLAKRELALRFGVPVSLLRIGLEHSMRADGCRLLIDADVTAEIRAAAQRGGR